ncbi:hypothetical protein N0V95_006192 [Ascochyta clinopodiicola]|nr:hypothetical protein N0V95_006192 [Ascochyta clinopodiicola]
MPLRAGKVLKGCLILGLNPRRGFDPDHRQFVADLARQLRELVVRVTTNVEAQERERHLMTELSDTEQRISKIIDVVPVGIYEMAADGKLKWANKHYFEILGVPPDERETSSFDWAKWVLPEDEWQASEHLESVGMEAVERSGSMRLKRFYTPPNLGQDAPVEEEPSWIFYSASPDHRADGSVRSVMGSLLDVSHLKWSELQHIRNAKAAREDKEKQEEFIDITSHEMRNPLSAITHCAESVVMSLQEAKDNQNIESLVDIIKLNAEAAESILFCAAHQRRIVDEVLTLGKLDSGLLTVSPAPFHLPDLLDQMIQVFKIEFAVNNIELQTVVDEVLATSSNSTVYSDSSRLMQILTNLLTNAIKFTRTQDIKEITIRCGWSSCVPSSNLFGDAFEWSPSGKVRTDSQHGPDHEQGDIVYLYFAIVDSGRGISDLFKDKVFSKFEQADRRTHTQYGGSGLGLYISRELVEMQGGRIGLDTTDGVGSTFAFYTKARRSAVEYESSIDTVDSAQPTTETLQASTPPQLESNPSPATLPAQTNYNILLVEDNLLNQKILVKQLRKSGCTVHAANNGGEAIDTLLQLHSQPPEFGNAPLQDPPQLPFDCILMDWEMPICDGLRATTRIRALETQTGSARNLIIGVTANAREEQIRFAIEAGMDTVVPKPFRVRELFERIKALVALRRLQDLTLECAE